MSENEFGQAVLRNFEIRPGNSLFFCEFEADNKYYQKLFEAAHNFTCTNHLLIGLNTGLIKNNFEISTSESWHRHRHSNLNHLSNQKLVR